MRQATWGLRIAKIIPFTYQKWPCTIQPSCILQTTSPKPYILSGKALMVGISQLSQMLNSIDGHAINSLHGILQTTSSKLNALLRLRIAKSFHLHIKDGHGLNSHPGILQTTASDPYLLLSRKLMGVFKAKWRPRIA